MNDTAFMPRPDMEERLSVPYIIDNKTGHHVLTRRTKADVWPAGVVYGTVLNQANWLIANLNRGVFKDYRLISEATFQEVMTRQYDQFAGPIARGWLNETTGYGLTWWISERNGSKLFAHSGSVSGYTAFIAGNLDKKTGFVILTNGHRSHPHLYKLAIKALDLLE
jgi:CubicO group peptidase (beta-lactamase class C family)